jgi:hypothetical protein
MMRRTATTEYSREKAHTSSDSPWSASLSQQKLTFFLIQVVFFTDQLIIDEEERKMEYYASSEYTLSRVMPSRTHTRKAATTQIKAGNQPRKK